MTGSPGARGFSTYLGVLIEPGDRAKMRERQRDRERGKEEKESEEKESERDTHTHTETVKSFQMGL